MEGEMPPETEGENHPRPPPAGRRRLFLPIARATSARDQGSATLLPQLLLWSGPETNRAQYELANIRIHAPVCGLGLVERVVLVVGVNDRSRHLRVRIGVVVLGLDRDRVAHWPNLARAVQSPLEI